MHILYKLLFIFLLNSCAQNPNNSNNTNSTNNPNSSIGPSSSDKIATSEIITETLGMFSYELQKSKFISSFETLIHSIKNTFRRTKIFISSHQ